MTSLFMTLFTTAHSHLFILAEIRNRKTRVQNRSTILGTWCNL